MFISTKLIEETERPPGLIFGMWGYFWPDKIFCTFDRVMTHFGKCEKSHKCLCLTPHKK